MPIHKRRKPEGPRFYNQNAYSITITRVSAYNISYSATSKSGNITETSKSTRIDCDEYRELIPGKFIPAYLLPEPGGTIDYEIDISKTKKGNKTRLIIIAIDR
jgi:hypothetical protein